MPCRPKTSAVTAGETNTVCFTVGRIENLIGGNLRGVAEKSVAPPPSTPSPTPTY